MTANDVSQAQLEKGRNEQNENASSFYPKSVLVARFIPAEIARLLKRFHYFTLTLKPPQLSSLISTKGGWPVQLFDGVDR